MIWLGMVDSEQQNSAVPLKRFRVGEVVDHTGLSRQTLHNYTLMGLIRESWRTVGGQRLYDGSVFGDLAQIQQMKQNKLTLLEIREALQHSGKSALASGPLERLNS